MRISTQLEIFWPKEIDTKLQMIASGRPHLAALIGELLFRIERLKGRAKLKDRNSWVIQSAGPQFNKLQNSSLHFILNKDFEDELNSILEIVAEGFVGRFEQVEFQSQYDAWRRYRGNALTVGFKYPSLQSYVLKVNIWENISNGIQIVTTEDIERGARILGLGRKSEASPKKLIKDFIDAIKHLLKFYPLLIGKIASEDVPDLVFGGLPSRFRPCNNAEGKLNKLGRFYQQIGAILIQTDAKNDYALVYQDKDEAISKHGEDALIGMSPKFNIYE